MKRRARSAFTLIEMLIALFLTAVLFVYLYGTLDQVKKDHTRYLSGIKTLQNSQRIYDILVHDLTEIRGPLHIVHEAGYDRIDMITDHSVYDIPRPWVHWFVSQKDHALIRIEATAPIDFLHKNYLQNGGAAFFADRFAQGCDSLRFTLSTGSVNMMIRCRKIEPILSRIFVGDGERRP